MNFVSETQPTKIHNRKKRKKEIRRYRERERDATVFFIFPLNHSRQRETGGRREATVPCGYGARIGHAATNVCISIKISFSLETDQSRKSIREKKTMRMLFC